MVSANGWPSTGPRQRVGLHIGEELHRLDDALLDAIAAVLDAAEGRHLDPVAWLFPEVADADLQPVDIGDGAPRSLTHTPDERPKGVEFEIAMTASAWITQPVPVSGSCGSPNLLCFAFSSTCGTRRSATLSCTRIRLIAVQRGHHCRWPRVRGPPRPDQQSVLPRNMRLQPAELKPATRIVSRGRSLVACGYLSPVYGFSPRPRRALISSITAGSSTRESIT